MADSTCFPGEVGFRPGVPTWRGFGPARDPRTPFVNIAERFHKMTESLPPGPILVADARRADRL